MVKILERFCFLRLAGAGRDYLNADVTRRHRARRLTLNGRCGRLEISRVFNEYGFFDRTGYSAGLGEAQRDVPEILSRGNSRTDSVEEPPPSLRLRLQ
jgi:hypothetical protein